MKRVGVDIGGTFTDLVWFDDELGTVGKAKTLSTADPIDGLLAAFAEGDVATGDVSLFLHATTLITNLVLERRGAKVGLITTRGFRDLLELQLGIRPNPYDLQWRRTEPLVPRYRCAEVPERVDARGRVIAVPTRDDVREAVERLVVEEVDAIAICFLNSYASPANEELVARLVREGWPHLHVCCSTEIDPRMREYPRMSTTVVNAYALPAFTDYATRLQDGLALDAPVRFMQSSGGITGPREAARAPVNLVHSGPAGGVLGARRLGRVTGLRNLITLDMGGTSSDVCVITDGRAGEREELDLDWNLPVRTQTIDISAIGAGGGSIAAVDVGGALHVGPESARGRPGPACYGLGGTRATVTDANLVLGLLRADRSLGRSEIRLDRDAATRALASLGEHFAMSPEEAAMGVFRTVNAGMAQAIREITVFKGIDPRDYALVAFGGCGPQHAAEVAREVGMTRVIVPALPSVFSALGLLTASLVKSAARTLHAPLGQLDAAALRGTLSELERAAIEPLAGDPIVRDVAVSRIAYLRYVGQSHELAVEVSEADAEALYAGFEAEHEAQFGTRLGDPVELVDVKVTAVGSVDELPAAAWRGGAAIPAPTDRVRTAMGTAEVYVRATLAAGAELDGAALIEEEDSTTYVPPDGKAVVDEHGNIHIELAAARG